MEVIINNKKYQAEYKSTPDELQQGMMGRNSIDGCMVFNMGGKGVQSFWMKNCLIDLDIVFVLNGRITTIHRNCSPAGNKLTPPRYKGIADHVIEFNGGDAHDMKI